MHKIIICGQEGGGGNFGGEKEGGGGPGQTYFS